MSIAEINHVLASDFNFIVSIEYLPSKQKINKKMVARIGMSTNIE